MKILMVCLGNICRSPMAEGVLRKELEERGISAQVDSAGTAAYHVGESPDPRGRAELLKYGIDISYQKARKFSTYHFEVYDYIFAMDKSNYSDIVFQSNNSEERDKVDMFMNQSNPGKNVSIPDPYYGGDQGFSEVYKMLVEASKAFADKIEKNI